jgi:FAD/FMN-containing dehydrogenase
MTAFATIHPATTPLADELAASIPGLVVVRDADAKAGYETDWRGLYSYTAEAVVLPETVEQVAAIVRFCAAGRFAVVPQGGRTGLVAGGVPRAGGGQVLISLKRLTRIRALDTVGDTITVEAGVTLQGVQQAAAAAGRLFPVSLGAEGTAQIGGVISTNAGGIQVLRYGSMRAQVLGLEVVLADGTLWDGLRALRKDNTGYDMKQMFIGAEGTLGIITAATLRLSPAVTRRQTALIGVADLAGGVALFQTLRAQAQAGLSMAEFMIADAFALGVAHVPGARAPFAAPAYVLAEWGGEDLAPLEAALDAGLATDAVVAQSERERADFLRIRESVSDAELATGGAVKHDIGVPIGELAATLSEIEALVAARFAPNRLNVYGHMGDGNLHVNLRPGPGLTLAELDKAAISEAVEAIAVRHNGTFSAEHGIGQMKLAGMAAHKNPVELAMMRAVKDALDPGGIMNPGKVLAPVADDSAG